MYSENLVKKILPPLHVPIKGFKCYVLISYPNLKLKHKIVISTSLSIKQLLMVLITLSFSISYWFKKSVISWMRFSLGKCELGPNYMRFVCFSSLQRLGNSIDFILLLLRNFKKITQIHSSKPILFKCWYVIFLWYVNEIYMHMLILMFSFSFLVFISTVDIHNWYTGLPH